ncbi:MAG: flavin reductase [Rhodospirillales bacterium]|nr:flavin reductase [Rhodospirillales bacterium]
MPVSSESFRAAMARLGAAVNIVTTDGPGGRYGCTASAVCGVTDSPPTLLVCLNRSSESNAAIKRNGLLCVNVLAHHHDRLSSIFAGLLGHEGPAQRFEHGAWEHLSTGAPVLADAAVVFDCRLGQSTEVGTHTVFFAAIEQIRITPNAAVLIWFDRSYHRLPAP